MPQYVGIALLHRSGSAYASFVKLQSAYIHFTAIAKGQSMLCQIAHHTFVSATYKVSTNLELEKTRVQQSNSRQRVRPKKCKARPIRPPFALQRGHESTSTVVPRYRGCCTRGLPRGGSCEPPRAGGARAAGAGHPRAGQGCPAYCPPPRAARTKRPTTASSFLPGAPSISRLEEASTPHGATW